MQPEEARLQDVRAWLSKAQLDLKAAAHEISAPAEDAAIEYKQVRSHLRPFSRVEWIRPVQAMPACAHRPVLRPHRALIFRRYPPHLTPPSAPPPESPDANAPAPACRSPRPHIPGTAALRACARRPG